MSDDFKPRIAAPHTASCGAAREALCHALRAGRLLVEAKSQVGHQALGALPRHVPGGCDGFDLPRQLFELYAEEGVLSRRRAADLKAAFLGEFTAIYAPADQIKIFNFRLASGWLDGVRANLDRDVREGDVREGREEG